MFILQLHRGLSMHMYECSHANTWSTANEPVGERKRANRLFDSHCHAATGYGT